MIVLDDEIYIINNYIYEIRFRMWGNIHDEMLSEQAEYTTV